MVWQTILIVLATVIYMIVHLKACLGLTNAAFYLLTGLCVILFHGPYLFLGGPYYEPLA